VRLVDVRRLGRGALQVCAARLRRHALRGGKEALQEGALLCAGRTACMQRPAALTHSPAGTAIRGSQTVAQGGEEVPQSKTFSYHKSLLVRHVSVVTCMLTVTGSQVRNTVHMTLQNERQACTKERPVAVVAERVQHPYGAAGVANGLLHIVQRGWPLLRGGAQLLSLCARTPAFCEQALGSAPRWPPQSLASWSGAHRRHAWLQVSTA